MRARRAGWLPLRTSRIGSIRFDFDPAIGHYMHAMKTGEYEWETVAAIRRYLRQGSTYVDIGANIGYLAAWGLHTVGVHGTVHAFEPGQAMGARLDALKSLNPRRQLEVHHVALGDAAGEGTLTIAGDGMLGGSSMLKSFIPQGEIRGSESVPLARFDACLDASSNSVGAVAFMRNGATSRAACITFGLCCRSDSGALARCST